jgi:hypothetical protein
MTTVYQNARKEFFNLEPGQTVVIKGTREELEKFRDSIYKLARRYRAYDKLYKMKFLKDKQLQICRIK